MRLGLVRYSRPRVGLLACPFCRELFEQGEAKACPVCGMELAKFEDLPPSIEADEGGVPTAPENELLPWTFFGRSRGPLAILAIVGMVLFFLPWVVRTFPDTRAFATGRPSTSTTLPVTIVGPVVGVAGGAVGAPVVGAVTGAFGSGAGVFGSGAGAFGSGVGAFVAGASGSGAFCSGGGGASFVGPFGSGGGGGGLSAAAMRTKDRTTTSDAR
jgi:hypothetical protein